MNKNTKKISVVVPCFNEESTVELFYRTASPVLEKTGYDYEIIFVNDGSSDKTAEIIKELAAKDKRVKAVNFSRNFGQQAAILCGYRASGGDAVIELDCDLQDPVEVIFDMLKMWEQGYEVVHGRRTERRGESAFKRLTAYGYYKFLSRITGIKIPRNTGDFKLYDRKVIDVIISMPETDKYLRGLASWVGFKQGFVDFKRNERAAGETKYTLKKMIKLAKSGIVSNSDWPLSLSLKCGISTAVLSVATVIVFIVLSCVGRPLPLAAWLFPFVAAFFSVGRILDALTNMYISRVYAEVKGRPDYVISDTVNLDNPVL